MLFGLNLRPVECLQFLVLTLWTSFLLSLFTCNLYSVVSDESRIWAHDHYYNNNVGRDVFLGADHMAGCYKNSPRVASSCLVSLSRPQSLARTPL